MAVSKEELDLTKQLVDLARERGYHDEDIEVLIMFSCERSMVKRFGSSMQATVEILKYCQESKDQEECFAKIFDLLGIEKHYSV